MRRHCVFALKEVFGTAEDDFCRGFLHLMYGFVDLSADIAETELNFLLSVVKSGKPKDEPHAMLLLDMGVNRLMKMRNAEYGARIDAMLTRIKTDLTEQNPYVVDKIPALIDSMTRLQDSNERYDTRLTRNYCELLDASNRHRRSGEHAMTVQQLTVGAGGQAIVGHVTHSSPQTAPNNSTGGPRALTDQQQSPLSMIGEPDREVVPLRRGEKR